MRKIHGEKPWNLVATRKDENPFLWTYSDMASCDIGHHVFRMPDGAIIISRDSFFGEDYSSGSGSWTENL